MNGKSEWGRNPIPRVRIENEYEAKVRMREEMAKERTDSQSQEIKPREGHSAKHKRSTDVNTAPLKRARISIGKENDPDTPESKLNNMEQEKGNATALAINTSFEGLAKRNGMQKNRGNMGCTDDVPKVSLREGPDPGLSEGCTTPEKAKQR